jgi:hypothetical protein
MRAYQLPLSSLAQVCAEPRNTLVTLAQNLGEFSLMAFSSVPRKVSFAQLTHARVHAYLCLFCIVFSDTEELAAISTPAFFLAPLFPPGAFFGHCVVRERPLIRDNRLDHFADVRAQEPIDCDAHKLRRIQDRASLHDCVNSLFLIWP